jgi:tetratricopeptide (TPR) repeat protein
VVAGLLIALAGATVAMVLASGDDGGDSSDQASQPANQGQKQQRTERQREQQDRTAEAPAQPAPETEAEPAPAPEAETEAAPAPEPEPEQPSGGDNASGAELNDQGFKLMNAGRYDEAIPVLQRAVESLSGTNDVSYAYALFNLGRSLRLAGRPDEAIPILEQRLAIPNQRGVVRRELDAARREAGQG